uniref:Uncharacterized protein n=1 Tax=Alexandrium monilatum TaxID=311494 RepID=A0A7S4PXN7_9DINO
MAQAILAHAVFKPRLVAPRKGLAPPRELLPAHVFRRRGSRAFCGLVMLAAFAAAWLVAPCFVQPLAGQATRTEAPSSPAPAAIGLTAASWLAASQPAFTDGPLYPRWPRVLVLLAVFSLLFVIPNAIFK